MEVLEITEKEMMQKNVEEFERLQDYMVSGFTPPTKPL